MDTIFPQLTPLSVDPAHPFPFLANRGYGLAMTLLRQADGRRIEGLLLFPPALKRFIRLPKLPNAAATATQPSAAHASSSSSVAADGSSTSVHADVTAAAAAANLTSGIGGPRPAARIRYIMLEDVVLSHMADLFPAFAVVGKGMFRILRDSDMEIDEEAVDLVRTFETALKRRRRGHVINLVVDAGMPPDLYTFLLGAFDVRADDTFVVKGIVGVGDVRQVIADDRPRLAYPPYIPRYPERIREHGGDIFGAIRAKDILVHHVRWCLYALGSL